MIYSSIINRSGGAGGGQVAKDALGNDVIAEVWLKNHGPGDRTLTQGLKVLFSHEHSSIHYCTPNIPTL